MTHTGLPSARHLPRFLRRLSLLSATLLALGACASGPAKESDRAAAAPTGSGTPAAPPPPRSEWQGVGAIPAAGPSRPAARADSAAPGFTPFSQDPEGLYAEVSLICSSARSAKEPGFLTSLVADLYRSEIEPGLATDAMIRAECAPIASIVREMVTWGGEGAVDAVAERALESAGPKARRAIEIAAYDGLDRNLGADAAAPSIAPATPAPGADQGYAMAYFQSKAESARVESAATPDRLYTRATPGYGLYTFVLLGGTFDPKSRVHQGRYAELLRVIETYVLGSDQGVRVPTRESHGFLIAVQPNLADAPLVQQTWPELSAPMRRDLVRALRRQGQSALARRLETQPGPFLVSSAEPRLVPAGPLSPRLIADLSAIGAENMYTVVDAYDRPVPTDPAERLGPIRQRLLDLGERPASPGSGNDAWVVQLGGPPPAPPDRAAVAPAPVPAAASTSASDPAAAPSASAPTIANPPKPQ